MRTGRLRVPSPAMIVAAIALFVALGGVGYAAVTIPRNSVSSESIRDGAVRKADIRANAVDGGKVAANALTGADIRESSLGPVPSAVGLKSLPLVRATPTSGADAAAARAAAPPITLLTRGQLSIYAKCMKDVALNVVRAEVFVRTAADGAIATGGVTLDGGDGSLFLNVATPELDRRIDQETAGLNLANLSTLGSVSAVAADGTSLRALTHVAAKNGTLAGPAGQGLYGAGDVCLFGGFVSG